MKIHAQCIQCEEELRVLDIFEGRSDLERPEEFWIQIYPCPSCRVNEGGTRGLVCRCKNCGKEVHPDLRLCFDCKKREEEE